mgnify:CR=1 FL=1
MILTDFCYIYGVPWCPILCVGAFCFIKANRNDSNEVFENTRNINIESSHNELSIIDKEIYY